MNLEKDCYRVDLRLIGSGIDFQFIVEAMISDLGRLARTINLIVDTGATLPMLLKKSDAVQMQARLHGESSSIMGISLKNVKSVILERAARVTLRTTSGKLLRFSDVPAEVLEPPRKKKGGVPRDLSWSLIGLPFLKKYNMIVDTGKLCLWIPKEQRVI